MKNIKSSVCKKANWLIKEGYTKSAAFITAWTMVKNENGYSPKEEKGVEDMTLTEKVRKYKELQMAIEKLEEQMNEVKEAIIKEMETEQAEEISVDIYKVRYITVISNRFNTTDFKKENKGLYERYLKESVCKRFTVA